MTNINRYDFHRAVTRIIDGNLDSNDARVGDVTIGSANGNVAVIMWIDDDGIDHMHAARTPADADRILGYINR